MRMFFLQESANTPNETKFQLSGPRIVNINHVFSTLKSMKHQSFECSFHNIEMSMKDDIEITAFEFKTNRQ
jgi:hypothetical protein